MSAEDDLTIVSSWAPKAYQCFASELEELQQLQQQHEQHMCQSQQDLETRCRAEVDARLHRDFPDIFPCLKSPLSLSRSGAGSVLSSPPLSSSGLPSGKRPRLKPTQQLRQSEAVVAYAKRDALLQQHIQAAMVTQRLQPARQLAAQYAEQLSSTQRQVGLYLEREANELRRFTTKPLSAYALGEVLEAPPVTIASALPAPEAAVPSALLLPHPTAPQMPKQRIASAPRSEIASNSTQRCASERSTAAASNAGSNRQRPKKNDRSGRSDGAVPSHAHVADKGGATVVEQAGLDRHAELDAASLAVPPPFLIDAHQFAVDYNEMLKREYGFRPSMTNTLASEESKAGCEAADVVAALKGQLRTHAAGITSKRLDVVASNRALPPLLETAASCTTLASGSLLQPVHADTATERGGMDSKSSLAHSFPKRKQAQKVQPAFTKQTTAGGSTSNTRQEGRTAAALSSVRGGGSLASSSVNPLNGVRCSCKSGRISLSTCVGVPSRQVIRFVNQNGFRTRLRLKPSSHPWLAYRCVRVAPSAGAAVAVVPEMPLNCGGYMEVEVIFCPTSIEEATATLETVLEMGVARELNDRVGEGAQWQFMTVSLQGQVVLPHFEWWRSATAAATKFTEDTSELVLDAPPAMAAVEEAGVDVEAMHAEECADTQAPPLIAHDALVSRAVRLGVSDFSAAVVEFGKVLLLDAVRQTIYVENTGSTAVVHVQSSSPEFTVSLPPVVATTLSSGHAMPLHVSFCPLSEGSCKASLIVAVRASDAADSPILTEHRVGLLGIGVVPRVSITSLGSQLVQDSDTPQWQLGKGNAQLQLLLKGTIPDLPTEVPLTVRNDCAVPLPYHWHGGVPSCKGQSNDSHEEAGQEGLDANRQACVSASGATATAPPLTTVDAAGVGADQISNITPAFGILPPMSTTNFTLTVTPRTLQPLQTLYNLFLDKMPDPSTPQNAAKLSLVDAEVLELYRRNRLIPCGVHYAEDDSRLFSDRAGSKAALPNWLQVTYLDPIAAFARFQSGRGEGEDYVDPNAVFVTGFLTYQQPALPTLSIDPAVVEERVECLIQSRTTRTVSLHNNSPIAMHFLLDPTAAEFAASVDQHDYFDGNTSTTLTYELWCASFPKSDGISVTCQPRSGLIAPHGTVTVTIHFTLEAIGPHYAVVPCWVPEVELLSARLTARCPVSTAGLSRRTSLSLPTNLRGSTSAGMASRRTHLTTPFQKALPGPGVCLRSASGGMEKRPKSTSGVCAVGGISSVTVAASEDVAQPQPSEHCGYYALLVTATGVGPTVTTSAELLDFGLIELGQEAAASFTVSNPNSIPVVFDLSDPLMRHPSRFVFIPQSFRLAAGNTVEVTVYRRVVSTEDAQTFFELTVRDGGASVAIETRATIQQPLLVVEDPVVQFGVVPEGVWQSRAFHVSNRSALDTAFTVIPATPTPSYMELDYEAEHSLRAGEVLTVPVRCRFHAHPPAMASYRSRPETSASLVRAQRDTATAAGDKDDYSTLLSVVSKRSRQALFVEVRCYSVETLSVSVDLVPDASPDDRCAAPSTEPMSTEAYVRALLWNLLEAALFARATAAADASADSEDHIAPLVVHPYCSTLRVVDYMLDDVPLSRCSLAIVVENYTGCEGAYEVRAKHFMPLPMEVLGTQGILSKQRKRAAEVVSRSVGGSRRGSGLGASGGSSKKAQIHLPEEQGQLLSTFSALESGVPPASNLEGGGNGSTLPAFWIKSVEKGVTVQQQQQQMVKAAQRVLGDGRRCVTLFGSLAGGLGPYGRVRIPVRLVCALPGRYVEQLCIRANSTLPWLQIPVDYEVYGKAIVLDPMTSGLMKEGGRDGKEVLQMPPVIAPLGTSRRTIRLVNRVSRDVDVTVEVFSCPLGMVVHAVDPGVLADQVELRLCSMTEEDREKERRRVGRVSATPFKLRIPAHSRREVLLEFTPTARAAEESLASEHGKGFNRSDGYAVSPKGRHRNDASARGFVTGHDSDGSEDDEDGEEAMLPPSEHFWQGSVCIHAMLAHSELNDIFLVDEFYTLYADRYPSQRVARPISGAKAGARCTTDVGGSAGGSLTVAQLSVMQPLRTRPGGRVVRDGRVVWPSEAAQRALDRAAAAGDTPLVNTTASALGRPASHSPGCDSDSATDGDESASEMSLFSQRAEPIPPLEVLQQEVEERQALVAFMESRRRTLQEESRKYFTSIELRLRARCGRPRLTIEPSERCVCFPGVPLVDKRAPGASLAVSHCRQTIRFTNRNSSSLRFALLFSSPNFHDSTDVFSVVRCDLWRSGHDAATQLFCSTPTTSSAGAVGHEYTLESMDALDVQVEVLTGGSAWRQACATLISASSQFSLTDKALAVEGVLKVQFLPTSELADTTCDSSDDCVPAPHQLLHLRVPLTTPWLECSPGVVWFRPGQQRHDGRRQGAYTQRFVLFNRSAIPVSFQICPVTDADEETIETFRLQQQEQITTRSHWGVSPSAVSERLLLENTTTTQLGVSATHRQCDSITRKVKAVVGMPAVAPPAEGRPDLVYVDEPSRFSLDPLEGVVPAASLGGECGCLEVCVTFVEFSNLRYESLFKVVAVGAAVQQPVYVLLRGDSRDTEV
ncbi:hypothetical protein JKF63_04636 [Porcisia hertigi]|uniref:Abnormal spindle-like microcephaly-associated protein ASH domain-containing protein n=1 Tax=Porcisia hertigi TaxID=2761500 RepID=A0A836L8F6_9TRYP|nr:hypothetical protein JKF63_04636 [Porcisia hertigi]